MKIHIGNVINNPPQQNAPMFKVLTSFILKGIEWGFRKYMSMKIPGMVHQGLLAPQGLCRQVGSLNSIFFMFFTLIFGDDCLKFKLK